MYATNDYRKSIFQDTSRYEISNVSTQPVVAICIYIQTMTHGSLMTSNLADRKVPEIQLNRGLPRDTWPRVQIEDTCTCTGMVSSAYNLLDQQNLRGLYQQAGDIHGNRKIKFCTIIEILSETNSVESNTNLIFARQN